MPVVIAGDIRMAGKPRKFARNFFRREHVVGVPGGYGAAGHAVMFRGFRILREGDAALRLNFAKAERTVRSGTGENSTNSAIPHLGKRPHKMIYRHGHSSRILAWDELELLLVNGHDGIGRNDVNIVGLDLHPNTV